MKYRYRAWGALADESHQLELERKAAAYDRLTAWLGLLEHLGVEGRFIATGDVRAVLECE